MFRITKSFPFRPIFKSINQGFSDIKKKYIFNFASAMIPHPEKVDKGGEDAYFTNKSFLAVADGVGGWIELGIDPGLYSKELCLHMKNVVEKDETKYLPNPKQLIIDIKNLTKAQGSTTVCVAVMDPNQQIVRTSFIGDSGYAIFRKIENQYQVMFKSKEQQKGFNFPYQIGSEGDHPNCAKTDQHIVQNNDIFVLGTDGLYDNVSDLQIKTILDQTFLKEEFKPLDFAQLLAQYTFKLSQDQKYYSPFAQAANQAGYEYRGGKSDDITIVVGQVKENIES